MESPRDSRPPSDPVPAGGPSVGGSAWAWDRRSAAQGLGILCLVLLALLAATLSATNFGSNDGPALIRYGEFTLDNGRFMRFQDFSYVEDPEAPNLHHQWLTEIIVALAWRGLGPVGVWAVKLAVLACVAVGLFRVGRRRLDWWLLALVAGLALVALVPRILLRGDFLSLGLLALFVGALARASRNRNWKALYWLVPLQLLWINLHPLGAVGALLVAAFCSEQLVRLYLRSGRARATAPARTLHLFVVPAAVLVASFVTPYGPEPLLMNFRFLVESSSVKRETLSQVTEFKSFLEKSWDEYSTILAVLFLAAVAASLAGGRKVGAWLLLAWLGTSVLALVHYRMVGFPVVLSAAVLLQGLTRVPAIVRWGNTALQQSLQRLAPVAALAAAAWLGAVAVDSATDGHYLRNDMLRAFGRLDANLRQPWGAAEFLKDNGIRGRIFNNTDIGSFLVFALESGSSIYLDTQFLYSRKTFLRYRKLLSHAPRVRAELEKQDVDCVLIKHISLESRGLVLIMLSHPDWGLVYLDECAMVFLPRESGGRTDLPEVTLAGKEPVDLLYRGAASDPRALISLAYALGLAGYVEQAQALYETALARNGCLYLAWYNLAATHVRKGEYDRALACYVRCLRVKGSYGDARKGLRWLLESGLVSENHPDFGEARDLAE